MIKPLLTKINSDRSSVNNKGIQNSTRNTVIFAISINMLTLNAYRKKLQNLKNYRFTIYLEHGVHIVYLFIEHLMVNLYNYL